MVSSDELNAAQQQINAARDQTHTNIAAAKSWADLAKASADLSGAGSAVSAAADANRAEIAKDAAFGARDEASGFADSASSEADRAASERGLAEAARDRAEAVPVVQDGLLASIVSDEGSESRTALNATYARLSGLPVNVRDYGAVGDGTTDDSPAIQSALNAAQGRTLLVPPGTYRIDTPLTHNGAHSKVICEGTLLAGSANIAVLTVNGNDNTVQMRVDGGNAASVGVWVKGERCSVIDGTFENFATSTSWVNAIRAETGGGVTIARNTIRQVTASGDGDTGNAIGACRAIYATHTGTPWGDTFINDNIITDVEGEEGDAIHVMFGTTPPFLEGRVTISGNQITTVSRRFVKVQAAGTLVKDNVIRHFGPDPGGSAAAAITVIHSDNCEVTGNSIDTPYLMGIGVTGASARHVLNTVVSNNTLTIGSGKVAVYVGPHVTGASVSGNRFTTRDQAVGMTTSLWLEGAADVTVSGNTFFGSYSGGVSMRALSSCSRLVIKDNTGYGGARNWLIQNDAPGSVVENNHARWTSGTGGCVAAIGTSTGSSYRNNTTITGPAVYGSATGVLVSQSRGNQDTRGGDVFWCESTPETSLPSIAHKKGDVAFSTAPAAGGPVGWVCVTSGTPGSWKSFGTIAA